MAKKSKVSDSEIVCPKEMPELCEVTTEIVAEKAVHAHRFIFSNEEIESYNGRARAIIGTKASGKFVQRGAETMFWKLIVGVAKAQTVTFILTPRGNLGTRCQTCGMGVAWAAECVWMDRFYVEGVRQEKKFVIHAVCEECLKAAKADYLSYPDFINVVAYSAGTATYVGLHDAKSYKCALCEEHSTDSTFVQIPNGKSFLSVPVCDKHFDLLIAPEENLKSGKMSKATEKLLKSFSRVTNKKEGK